MKETKEAGEYMLTVIGGRPPRQLEDLNKEINILINLVERNPTLLDDDLTAEEDPLFIEHALDVLEGLSNKAFEDNCTIYMYIGRAGRLPVAWPVWCYDMSELLKYVTMIQANPTGHSHVDLYPVGFWAVHKDVCTKTQKLIEVSRRFPNDESLMYEALEKSECFMEIFPSSLDVICTPSKRDKIVQWVQEATSNGTLEVEWRIPP